MPNHLLSSERIEELCKYVQQLLDSCNGCKNSSDILQKLIKDNDIDLQEVNLMELSGLLFKSDNNKWSILVNKMDSNVRKLFTIAHELGHYYLHKDKEDRFIDGGLFIARDENSKFDEYEVEANEFAGNLLMPKSKIEAELPNKNEVVPMDEIRKLSEKFLVSTFAIQTRLKNLDYQI